MRLDLGPTLAQLKIELMDRVDREAEAARLLFITPGAGQALEYQATEAQARAWAAAVNPVLGDYPFVQAEVLAREAATGTPPDIAVVVADIIAEADAWQAAGALIKQRRRAAKMAIEAATTAAAARLAAVVEWPTPPT